MTGDIHFTCSTRTHTPTSREQLKRWTSRRSRGDSGTNGATAAAQICWPCKLMRGSSVGSNSSSSVGSDKKACELPANGLGLAASTLRNGGGRRQEAGGRKEQAAGQLDRQLERQGHLAAAKIAKLKLKCKCCNERRTHIRTTQIRMHYAYAAYAAAGSTQLNSVPTVAVAKTSQSN